MAGSEGFARGIWFLNGRVDVRISFEDGHDGISVLEHRLPQGDSPPLHIHHNEDEVFHVLAGHLRFVVEGAELRAGPGDTLTAPKGKPHTYRVESAEARLLTITVGRDFERFVRAFGRPAEGDGLPAPSGPPTPEQAQALAAACRAYGIELVGPPMAATP